MSSIRAAILSEGKLSAYFLTMIIGFLLLFHLVPSSKIVNNYYYIFMFAPAFFAIYLLRNRLDLRRPETILWGLLFLLCVLSAGSWNYIKHIVYTAVFLLIVSRIIPGDFFRISVIVRGIFWIKIIHVFVSMVFYGWLGDYVIGGQLHGPLGPVKMNCILTSIILSACLMLVLPFWIAEKRWVELGTGLILSIVSSVYILQSRSGLVAMLAIFILIPGYLWHMRRLRLYMAGLMLVVVLLMCLVIWITPDFVSRMDSGRFEMWQNLLIDWKQCGYLSGCGGGFQIQRTFEAGGFYNHTHNIYFAFAFYNGLPAAFVFIGLCFYLLHKAWKNRDPWGGYLLSTMIGLNFDGGQIISNPSPLWIAILLPMAMISNSKRGHAAEERIQSL